MSHTPEKTPHHSLPLVSVPSPLLSTFLFQPTPEKENDRVDCVICLCSLNKIDSDISETKCKHLFHRSCLDEMKSKSKSQCPICRAPLTPPTNPPSMRSEPHRTLSTSHSNQMISNVMYQNHTVTPASIVNAARRGREAVRLAIVARSQDVQLTPERGQLGAISSF